MLYSLENIYYAVGKDDKVASLTLKPDSESCEKYGREPTVVFQYTQRERELMDKKLLNNSVTTGKLKAKVLGYGLPFKTPTSEEMEYIEINSQDIEDIYFLPYNLNLNTFHSEEKRRINKLNIEINSMPHGGDWDWYYGFEKRRVEEDGIILSPEEQYRYLALKLFYEPSNLTDEEKTDIFVTENSLNEYVGFYYFKILEDKGIKVSDKVVKKLKELFHKRMYEKMEFLNKYLLDAGSSFKKLIKEDPDMLNALFTKLLRFRQKRLNVLGRYPIYMDVDSYLHILTRHVEDYKFNNHYKEKDNFQWEEEDVILVIEKVIREIDEKYQAFRSQNTTLRYSRYGDNNVYFEGDYYTLHIEPSGRLGTFYKNKKNTNTYI
jgi:hypothetical protein